MVRSVTDFVARTWPYMIPHGEERPAGPRLEPWATAASGTTLAALALPPSPCGLRRTSRDAALRAAPQGEGGVGGTHSEPYMIPHGEEGDRRAASRTMGHGRKRQHIGRPRPSAFALRASADKSRRRAARGSSGVRAEGEGGVGIAHLEATECRQAPQNTNDHESEGARTSGVTFASWSSHNDGTLRLDIVTM